MLSDLHFLWIDFYHLAVLLNVGIIRADIHQLCNGTAGFIDRIALKQLAHLIENHYRYALRVFADDKSAYRGYAHQEIFIENLPVGDVSCRIIKHASTDDCIRD